IAPRAPYQGAGTGPNGRTSIPQLRNPRPPRSIELRTRDADGACGRVQHRGRITSRIRQRGDAGQPTLRVNHLAEDGEPVVSHIERSLAPAVVGPKDARGEGGGGDAP